MPSAFALAPLALAAVLVLSGLAKLPDPRSTHSMMTELRLPEVVANRTVARLLPWAELTVAALLLTPWRWPFALGALAAAGLFLTFWVVIARAMTFDPRPACPCFGQVGDHRITWRTVVRNTVLLALALLTTVVALLSGTGTGLLAEFGTGDWAWLVLAAALATVAVLMLGAAPRSGEGGGDPGRTVNTPDRRVGGPAVSPAQEDQDRAVADGLLVDRDHEVVPLRQLTAQEPQLLVLVNCWCGSTMATIDRLPGWRERLPRLGVQLVHTHAPWDEPRLTQVPGVWWDPGARVYATLGAGPSPTAVLVDTHGRVTAGPVSGVEEIDGLVDELADERGHGTTGGRESGSGSAAVRAPDAP